MDDAPAVEVRGGLRQQVTEYWKKGGAERNLHHKNAELLYLRLRSQQADEEQVLDHRLSLCISLNIVNISDLK